MTSSNHKTAASSRPPKTEYTAAELAPAVELILLLAKIDARRRAAPGFTETPRE